MADDGTGLDILISYRKQRPAFARMISWEFSRDRKQKVNKQRRSLKKKLSTNDEQIDDESDEPCSDSENVGIVQATGESEESGDSEYFSAEEESGIHDEDCVDRSEQISDGNEFRRKSVPQDVQISKRAPSKRQKRKRRQMKMFFVDKILPFVDIDDSEFEIFDTIESNIDFEDQRCSGKIVPTLVELCLHRVWGSKTKCVSSFQLPPGIQPTIKKFYRNKSYFRHQLSYFHTMLAECEPKDKTEFDVIYIKWNFATETNDKIFLRPARNICNSIFFSKYATQSFYVKSKAASFLTWTNSRVDYNNETNMKYQYGRNIIAAVATTIDLMIPSTLRFHASKFRHKSGERNLKNQVLQNYSKTRHASVEQDLISSATISAINRVRFALAARFPVVMEYCFDEALPYVFWARGNLSEATQLFTILMQREKRVRHKAMYLSEIARMYTLARETDLAIKFHRMAADVALQKPHFQDEITGQLLMLIANTYDQGIMSTQNAKIAAKAWNTVLATPCITTDQAAIAAIESFLCFHSGGWRDQETTWLEEAKTRILLLVKNHRELYFHLSLICSLLGEETEAQKHFRCFQTRNSDISVQYIIKDFSDRSNLIRRNPWMLLQDFIEKKTPVHPLVVVWRMQMSPLILPVENRILHCGDSNLTNFAENFADDECTQSCLRIGSNGYVTGDMQLLLPPVRGVYLDPYTGSLAITHIPGYTEAWKCLDTDQEHVVPTMVEVYDDPKGSTVHICLEDKSGIHKSGRSYYPASLHWTGPDGDRAKLNLMYLLKVEMRKFAEKLLKLDAINIQNEEDSKELTEQIKREIERAFNLGKCLDYEFLRNIAKQNQRLDKNWERRVKKGNVKTKQKSNHNRRTNTEDFHPSLVKSHCAFGHSILLPFAFPYSVVFVFVDCQSRELFLQPKVIVQKFNYKTARIWNISGTFNPNIELAIGCATFHFNKMRNCQKLVIYNAAGNPCDVLDNEMSCITNDDTSFIPRVIGQHLFLLDTTRRLVCRVANPFTEADVIGTEIEDDDKQFHSTVDVVKCVNEGEATSDIALTKASLTVNENDPEFCLLIRQRTKFVSGLETVKKTEVAADKLVVLTSEGVTFLDPDSLEPLVLNVTCHGQASIPLSPDHKWFKGNFDVLNIIGQKTLKSCDQDTVERVAVAIDNHLVILDVPSKSGLEAPCLSVVLCLSLPGHPREYCFISQSAGFLVSITMHANSKNYYREILLHLNYQGHLHGILPMLGPGPRGFCVTHLPGNPELTDKDPTLGTPGWYVYMRDGHAGIIGVMLSHV